MKLSRSAAVLALGIGALALAAIAQEDPPPLVESVDVEVVNVDVVVTDRDGNPVSGLTAEDFVVFEDGDERPVTNFYAFAGGFARPVAGEAPAPRSAGPAEPQLVRRIAVLFDTNTLTKRHRDASLDALRRYVLDQFDGSHEWAVIAYSDHLQYIQGFTSDKTAVIGALDRIADIPVAVSARLDQPLQVADPVMAEDVASRRSKGPSGLNSGDLQQVEVRAVIMENLRLLDRTTKAVVETMAAHGDLSGRKSLVLVTGVMRTLPTLEYIVGNAFEGTGMRADKTDPLILTLNTDVQARLQGIIRTANATGFSVYPVSSLAPALAHAPHHDANRRVSGALQSEESSATMPGELDLESAPKTLASATGGQFFATDDVDTALVEIDERTSNSYVLGFSPDHGPDGDYHRIRVEVRQPGLRIEAREGYLHLSEEDKMVQALSTPLAFPKAAGDIPVEVRALQAQEAVGGRSAKQPLTVYGTMPLQTITLVPRGDRLAGRVRLYLAVYDDQGQLVDLVQTHQDVEMGAGQLAGVPREQPVRFGLQLELKPGTYTVTLTMKDEVSDRYGTGFERLVI